MGKQKRRKAKRKRKTGQSMERVLWNDNESSRKIRRRKGEKGARRV